MGGNVQNVRCLTRPTQARQDAPFHGQGRSPFDARSVLIVREHGKRARTPLATFFNIPKHDCAATILWGEDSDRFDPVNIAAIVLEPTHFEKPTNDFLKKVRKIADDNNALLILDEIVTGFRFDLGGAQKYFDIKGDFVCFGKGMANGLPLSAITGPEEFMKKFDELWVSSSNNSEILSIAGTIAVINEMQKENTISHCWNVGKRLFDGWNKIVEKHNINAKMSGYPIRMEQKCYDKKGNTSLELKSVLLQEMVKKGIFMSPLGAVYLSYSHSNEDIERTLEILDEVCGIINLKIKNENYKELLEGRMPKTIWSMKIPPTKK